MHGPMVARRAAFAIPMGLGGLATTRFALVECGMGKGRQNKSGTKKKRASAYKARKSEDAIPEVAPHERQFDPIEGADGMMSGMVGGFRRAVGAERPENKSSVDGLLLWVLFGVALAFVAWRFMS